MTAEPVGNLEYRFIRLEVAGATALLTLARPEVLNALSPAMVGEMRDAVSRLARRDTVRCLLLTGEGRAFCSGADLDTNSDVGVERRDILEKIYNPLMAELHGLETPIVSAVNGLSVGAGVGLALSADIVVCARSAWFQHAFERIGLTSDCGTTWHLPRRCGPSRALEFSILGQRLDSGKALDWGMVNAVYEDEQLAAQARSIAEQIAQGPTLAYGGIKRLLRESLDNGFAAQLDREAQVQRGVVGSADFQEGKEAFRLKRTPVFVGH